MTACPRLWLKAPGPGTMILNAAPNPRSTPQGSTPEIKLPCQELRHVPTLPWLVPKRWQPRETSRIQILKRVSAPESMPGDSREVCLRARMTDIEFMRSVYGSVMLLIFSLCLFFWDVYVFFLCAASTFCSCTISSVACLSRSSVCA